MAVSVLRNGQGRAGQGMESHRNHSKTLEQQEGLVKVDSQEHCLVRGHIMTVPLCSARGTFDLADSGAKKLEVDRKKNCKWGPVDVPCC